MAHKLNFDGDRKAFFQYVREMADHLGLSEWYFEMAITDRFENGNHRFDINSEAAASCLVAHGSIRAELQFRSDWAQWEPFMLRHIVVHELIHCHTEPLRWAFNNTQAVLGNGSQWEAIEAAFDDAMEIAVDRMAMSWAQAMPLPGKAFRS